MADYGDTGRDNFDNFKYDGNEGNFGNYDFTNNNQNIEGDVPGTTGYDQNSLQLDKVFDKNLANPNYIEKEAEYTKKIEDLIDQKTGNNKITSNWPKITYFFNKILLGTILFEGLLDRFDIVGLTMCFVIFFIEINFYHQKHLYKWVAVLICSVIIDVLVFLDILFVSFLFI